MYEIFLYNLEALKLTVHLIYSITKEQTTISIRLEGRKVDYQNTPSFYNNEEFFNQYLGCTSYYTSLQNVVKKIIKITDAHSVLELGSALGTTTLAMAKEYPNIVFSGSDIRADVVAQANEEAQKYNNVAFVQKDMCAHVTSTALSVFDLIFLLYSFHPICYSLMIL